MGFHLTAWCLADRECTLTGRPSSLASRICCCNTPRCTSFSSSSDRWDAVSAASAIACCCMLQVRWPVGCSTCGEKSRPTSPTATCTRQTCSSGITRTCHTPARVVASSLYGWLVLSVEMWHRLLCLVADCSTGVATTANFHSSPHGCRLLQRPASLALEMALAVSHVQPVAGPTSLSACCLMKSSTGCASDSCCTLLQLL